MIKRVSPPGKDPDAVPRNPQPAHVLQKKDFVDRVVAASGAKKSDARPIIEATLAHYGVDAISGHFHDTYGQALSNTLASLEMGVPVLEKPLRAEDLQAAIRHTLAMEPVA